MQRDYWPLLALFYANERRLTPVQLQKTLFLVGQYVIAPGSDYYKFEPYHYGPFDQTIYSDIDDLAEQGLVERVESDAYRGFEFKLTIAGVRAAEREQHNLNPAQQSYLAECVPWVRSQTFRQLVMAIYSAFPWTAKNSVFKY